MVVASTVEVISAGMGQQVCLHSSVDLQAKASV
jgi:hypothetical protein